MCAKEVKMGKLLGEWDGNGRSIKTITLCVTEGCNLACKYCYMTGKNSKKRMSFETAKKAIDYILKDRENFSNDAVVWDIIGGEPFLEIALIDRITDYIKQQMLLLNHPWFDSYRFSFSTNGLLYNDPKVQQYIEKNKGHISIGISVDGSKVKHDLQRVYPNGEGSYEDVIRNVPLWIKQFGEVQTKATFAHDDLPYIKESIIELWNLGIKTVAANVVFEDVWQEGDDIVFENQLRELADYIIENELWNDYSVRFFEPHIGFPLIEEDLKRNFCGAGKMLAIDCDGKFFPCIRFVDFTLNNRDGLSIGDAEAGINQDKLRPFYGLFLENQSKKECIDCPVATGCAWCTGFNYDNADTETVYQRATYLCKMHKANVRAKEYFWKKYSDVTGERSPSDMIREKRVKNDRNQKYMQFLTEDSVTPHCHYRNKKSFNNFMSEQIIYKGIEFSVKNNFIPVFIGNQNGNLHNKFKDVFYILNSNCADKANAGLLVYDNNVNSVGDNNICTLIISRANIENIYELVSKLYGDNKRINIVKEEINEWSALDIKIYKEQLTKLIDLIIDSYQEGKEFEINILTDRMNLKALCDCDAGVDSIMLAPNGKFYICPAFYYEYPEGSIGDLENGINIKNSYLLELKNAPICIECDSYQCERCKFLNKKLTGEVNTPSKCQCVISHTERNGTRELQKKLAELGYILHRDIIGEISYLDPLDKIKDRQIGEIKNG